MNDAAMGCKPYLQKPDNAASEPLLLPAKCSASGGSAVGGKIPAQVNCFLRDYQRDGVRFIWDRVAKRDAGCILADDMGLGKTVQIIAWLTAHYAKTGNRTDLDDNRSVVTGQRTIQPVLIIAPSSLLANWEKELDTWGYFIVKRFYRRDRDETLRVAREGRCEIVVSTFETVREYVHHLNRVDWYAVVVDECHRIKEAESRLTKALKSLSCQRRIGLTGTALQNKYEELWCLLDWSNPGCLGSLKQFQSEFSGPMSRGFKFDATKLELATARNIQEKLNKLKSNWMLRRTKTKTIADQLPKKIDQVVFCALSPLQLRIFNYLSQHPDTKLVLNSWRRCTCGRKTLRIKCCYKDVSNSKSGASPQAMLFQLMHVFIKAANHAALLMPGMTKSKAQAVFGEDILEAVFAEDPEALEGWRNQRFLNMSDTRLSGKMVVLDGLLKVLEEQSSKVLLFSYSTSLLDILESYVQSRGYSYRRMDGNTRQEVRQTLVSEFNKDQGLFLFLLSTKVGGLGLNITGANAVIIFDPNWNPAHDLQAQDRAYRIGQTRDVRIFRLISVGCIEEIIYLRQVYKQQLSSALVDDEITRRYFLAVKGDPQRQGELFGMRNLFRVNPSGQCLTSDIEARNKEMEEKVRRRSKLTIAIQDNLLKSTPSSDSFEAMEKDTLGGQDPLNLGLNLDTEDPDQVDGLQWMAGASGVVYSHANNDIVGSSRVEQHMSACAKKDVQEARQAVNLPADVCDAMEPTQALPGQLDDGALGFSSAASAYNPDATGNKRRVLEESGLTYVYGGTPGDIRYELFQKMAASEHESTEDWAKQVLAMNFEEKIVALGKFYRRLGRKPDSDEGGQDSFSGNPTVVCKVLNSALEDFADEKAELERLGRSYVPPRPYQPAPRPANSGHKRGHLYGKPSSPLVKRVKTCPGDADKKFGEDTFSDNDDHLLDLFDGRPAGDRGGNTEGIAKIVRSKNAADKHQKDARANEFMKCTNSEKVPEPKEKNEKIPTKPAPVGKRYKRIQRIPSVDEDLSGDPDRYMSHLFDDADDTDFLKQVLELPKVDDSLSLDAADSSRKPKGHAGTNSKPKNSSCSSFKQKTTASSSIWCQQVNSSETRQRKAAAAAADHWWKDSESDANDSEPLAHQSRNDNLPRNDSSKLLEEIFDISDVDSSRLSNGSDCFNTSESGSRKDKHKFTQLTNRAKPLLIDKDESKKEESDTLGEDLLNEIFS